MKKRIALLLVMLSVAFCFVGCSNNKDMSKTDKKEMVLCANQVILWLDGTDEETFDYYREVSDFELNMLLLTEVKIPTTTENFLGMLDAWEAAEDECGELVLQKEYKLQLKETNEGFVVSTPAKFKERDATISVNFDKEHKITSVLISAEYSIGEILAKSGINTILGMGIVFLVLIFLAFVIGLMRFIPRLLGRKENKDSKTETIQPVEETKVEVATEPMDDLELVAVIMAAIAAQEGTTTDGFVVRSIRRRPSNRWK